MTATYVVLDVRGHFVRVAPSSVTASVSGEHVELTLRLPRGEEVAKVLAGLVAHGGGAPVPHCAACGAPAAADDQGRPYNSIHRDGLRTGPLAPLCSRCSRSEDVGGPTCEELWERIAKREGVPW